MVVSTINELAIGIQVIVNWNCMRRFKESKVKRQGTCRYKEGVLNRHVRWSSLNLSINCGMVPTCTLIIQLCLV